MTVGPLDGWDECQEAGCPSWGDTATDEAVAEFEDSDGWAHGVLHVHHIDHYLVNTREDAAEEDPQEIPA